MKKSDKKKVIVYSTPSCPWCHKVKGFMKEHKIKFTEIDVSKNEKAAREMIGKSGQQGVPVIDINGEIVIGYDEEKLMELLHLK